MSNPIKIQSMIEDNINAVKFVRGGSNSLLTPYDLDLTAAGTKVIPLQGNFIYISEASDADATVDLQFNRISSDSPYIKLVKSYGFIHPFDQLFLKWTAQPGKTMTVLVGSFAKQIMDIIDNRSHVDLLSGVQAIVDQLEGNTVPIAWGVQVITSGAGGTRIAASNLTRRSISVTADLANTGSIYLGLDNTVSSANRFIELAAGDSWTIDDYLGDIYAIAAVNGEQVEVIEV